METRNSKNISGLIMAKCGHVVHEHAEWLTDEQLTDVLGREQCDDCAMLATGLIYDARCGAYVTPEASVMVSRINNDTTLFVDRGNYSPTENVNDGHRGLGL